MGGTNNPPQRARAPPRFEPVFACSWPPLCALPPLQPRGSCHYGTSIPPMYAAWPDVQEGFGTSCGRCLEVACVNSAFNDGEEGL
jgi:hypothetical protein